MVSLCFSLSSLREGQTNRVGKVCQVGTKAEIEGGEDREDGDNQFWRQHTLPGAHALLTKGRVGRAVLRAIVHGGWCCFVSVAIATGATTATRCHDV